MPLLDQPFGWTWLLIIGWLGFRLLIALLLAVRQAQQIGRLEQRRLLVYLMFLTGGVFGVFGAVGWRIFAGDVAVGISVCFGLLTGCFGFVVGLIIDLWWITVRFQDRIAIAIVASKASWYAEQLSQGDPQQRIVAARALGFIGPKAIFAVPTLVEAFKDRDAELRYVVALALLNIETDDPAVERTMQNGLHDADPRVCVVAACGLTMQQNADVAKVLPILVAGLQIDLPELRELTCVAIGLLGPKASLAIPDLIALFGDDAADNLNVRYALALIGRAAVPALIQALKSENPLICRTAIETLGDMGPPASDALPVLRELLTTIDRWNRFRVQNAIGRIEPKAR